MYKKLNKLEKEPVSPNNNKIVKINLYNKEILSWNNSWKWWSWEIKSMPKITENKDKKLSLSLPKETANATPKLKDSKNSVLSQ